MKKIIKSLVVLTIFLSLSLMLPFEIFASTDNDYEGICIPKGRVDQASDIYNEATRSCNRIEVITNDEAEFDFYEVKSDMADVKTSCEKDGLWVGYLLRGDVIRNGETIKDGKGKKWLKYQCKDGGFYYIKKSKLKHHEHSWATVCRGDIGHTEHCEKCNTTRLVTDFYPYYDCGDSIICELVFGDWRENKSYASLLLGPGFKLLTKPFSAPRDLLAGTTHSFYEIRYGNLLVGMYDVFDTLLSVSGMSSDELTALSEFTVEYLKGTDQEQVATLIEEAISTYSPDGVKHSSDAFCK